MKIPKKKELKHGELKSMSDYVLAEVCFKCPERQ